MPSRRQFLKGLLTGLALSCMGPDFALASSNSKDPVFLALHLTGGNDALNTLIPHRNEVYKSSRSNLALSSKKLLTINQDLALNSNLDKLHTHI